MLTGVFSAEFGRGAGVVSVSTKSGTNQLHGTAFEFLRNDAFDARNFFVRKVTDANGNLVKDPVPPLDRHQFGGRDRRGARHPGAVRRPQPHVLLRRLRRHQGAARCHDGQHRADGGDTHRRLQQLSRPQWQPHPDLRPAHHAPRRAGTDRAGSVPEQHHPRGSAQSGRPQHRQRLSRPEHRRRQLRQLHLDARPGDHRQRVLRPRRSPALGQRHVLRPVQLRQVPSRCAAGPGQLLPADAGRRGRAIRPRPLRRRHPEHEADDARRGVQLLEGAEAARSSTNSASATRRPSRSRRSPTTATTPRSPSAFAASTSARSRPVCRTSVSRTSPASPAARRSCPSTPASSTTRSRTWWSG